VGKNWKGGGYVIHPLLGGRHGSMICRKGEECKKRGGGRDYRARRVGGELSKGEVGGWGRVENVSAKSAGRGKERNIEGD